MPSICLSVLPFPAASQTSSVCVRARAHMHVHVCVCGSGCVCGGVHGGLCACLCVCFCVCVSPRLPLPPLLLLRLPVSLVRRPGWGQMRAGGMRSCSKERCFVRRDGGELGWAVRASIGGLWSRSSGLGAVLLRVCVCV